MKVGNNTHPPLIDALIERSRLILFINISLIFLVAYGLGNLYVETDYKIFFDENDPNLIAEEQLQSTYGKSDNILFVVDPKNKEIFSTEVLSAIESLTEAAWQIPHSRRVDSISNNQHPSVDGDDITIKNLIEDAENYSDEQISNIRSIALGKASLVGRLISASGSASGINVTLHLPENNTSAIAEAVTKAREIKRAIEAAHPSIAIYLTGIAPTEQTLSEIATTDAKTLIPLMFFLVLLLLGLLLRSLSATICTIVIIAVSVIVGMGFAGWSGMAINNVNITAPTIIMTLAIADCVHVFNTFLDAYDEEKTKKEALAESLMLNIYPIFLTSVTTAFGFLTMNFSESPPFRELGTISAVGVLGAFGATIFILPGLIMLMPFKRERRKTAVNVFAVKLASLVIANGNKLFFGSLAVIILALSFLSKVELNDNPIGYFSKDTPARQAAEFVEQGLSGAQVVYYSLDSKSPDGIFDPAFLASAEKFTVWLRSQPAVVNVESFTDTLKRFNQILHDDNQQWYQLPESKPLAAQYFLLYELSLPYGLDVSNQVSSDKSSLKITATLRNQNSRGLIDFEEGVQRWFADEMPLLATPGASHSMSFAHIGQRNIESMMLGSLVAIILISLSLILTFRSLKYGLLSFVPNLFPALITLGVWGVVVGEVNMAASVVFSLTLGIIVDDTVHFMVKYIKARRQEKMGAESAVRYAFSTVGGALLSTSIVLATGFLVLAFSDFTVNSTSGTLVAMTISIAIVLDLLFLPTLLLRIDRHRKGETREA